MVERWASRMSKRNKTAVKLVFESPGELNIEYILRREVEYYQSMLDAYKKNPVNYILSRGDMTAIQFHLDRAIKEYEIFLKGE